MDDRIFLAIPTYNGHVSMGTMSGAIAASERLPVSIQCGKSSLLATGFNKLWIAAMKKQCTWWAMCHADIAPPPCWADTLIDEADKVGASVCSAVVPIKNSDGWVSTALCRDGKPAHYVMKEADLDGLPMTFTQEDVHKALNLDGILCVNTGLWVARLTEPWAKQVAFNISSWIDWTTDPPIAWTIPEDWGFSQQLHRLGVKVAATTACRVVHAGEWEWCLGGKQDTETVPTVR